MKMFHTTPSLFFFFLNLFKEQIKEIQISNGNQIVVWYLSAWQEIVGELQDIFILGSSCRILFCDGINVFVPLPGKDIVKQLRNLIGKCIGICRTDNPSRRYIYNFFNGCIPDTHTTFTRHKNDDEIAALKAHIKSSFNHGMNQQQLSTWMGGS